MSVTHTAAVRNQMADDFLDQCGPNAAYLRLEDGGALVSQHDFPSPSGTVTAATLDFTVNGGIAATSPTSGTIDGARLYTSGAIEICSMSSVGTAGTDITVSSVSIAASDTVTLTQLSWEAPA